MWRPLVFCVVMMRLHGVAVSLLSPASSPDIGAGDSQTPSDTPLSQSHQNAATLADIFTSLESIHSSLAFLQNQLDNIEQSQTTATEHREALAEQLHAIETAVTRWPRRLLGDPCLTDTDCHHHHVADDGTVRCDDGTCACAAGYRRAVDSRWRCERLRRLAEPCQADTQCGDNLICADLVCSCPSQFWNDGDVECRSSRQLGETCSDHLDCSGLNPDSVCSPLSGVCECAPVTHEFYQYRLSGGTSCDNGRVQFMLFQQWFEICDQNWHQNAAVVMCRSLGFAGGDVPWAKLYPMSPAAAAVTSSDVIYVTNVRCKGIERDLSECIIEGRQSTCPEEQVSMVACSD